MIPLDEKTFIGWSVRGLDPVRYQSNANKIVCGESGEAVRFAFFMGLLFGPGVSAVTILLLIRGDSHVVIAITAVLSLMAWYALYTSVFERRKIVFDSQTGTVQLFRGRKRCETLSRSEIVSVKLKPVERSMPGVSPRTPFRWTNYVISADLQSARGEMLLLESPIESTINELI